MPKRKHFPSEGCVHDKVKTVATKNSNNKTNKNKCKNRDLMNLLEVHGFHVDIIKKGQFCAYKYLGLYGIGGDA